MRYLSLFSGMEAAHLAWYQLGWECVGVAEIEPHDCAVLLAWTGQTFALGSTPIWVRDLAVAIALPGTFHG